MNETILNDRPHGAALQFGGDRIPEAVNRLLILHARHVGAEQIRAACEDLSTIIEHDLLRRERIMMAQGDPELATHVRRHGNILLTLNRQVREFRYGRRELSPGFIAFLRSLLEQEQRSADDSGISRAPVAASG